tara:strand:- start:3455 stop:4888 length:1434 start_codon:yes stop_codon:yes gene_type:complete
MDHWKLLGKNTDYPGNDIVAMSNISIDQCKDRCVSTTGCNGIVLDNNSKTCYLKTKMYDPYKRAKVGDDSYQYNGISRTSSSCNNSEDCLKQCEYSIIKENKNCFTGTAAESTSDHPLNLITMLSNYSNITTPSACGDKCRTTKDCQAFVWRDPSKHGQENNCQLRGGFYGHNPVSLINNCPDSGTSGWNTYLCKQPGGTIGAWEACDMSSICVSPYSFCRIGDNRCLSKSQCDWANSHDGTSRDCTPMPTPPSKQDNTNKSGFGETGPTPLAPPSVLYSCNNYTCSKDPNGKYTTLEDCNDACKTKYTCDKNTWEIKKDLNGQYATLDQASLNCKKPPPRYSCDILTSEIYTDPHGKYTTANEASINCQNPIIIPKQNVTQEMVDNENKITTNIEGQLHSGSNKLQSSYLHMMVWAAVAILVIYMIFYYSMNRTNSTLQTLITILICLLIIWIVASKFYNYINRNSISFISTPKVY